MLPLWSVLVWMILAVAASPPGLEAESPSVEPATAHALATAVAAVGPRAPGSPGHRRAQEVLLEQMAAVGLQQISIQVDGGVENLVGVLPGRSELEIVLSAHYDTVADSPGAGDDASGCGVVLATVAQFSDLPREHTLRVVLFDGEESGLIGSRTWVLRQSVSQREVILANFNVEMVGWAGSHGPVVHTFSVVDTAGRRRVSPGWLVHAVLKAGQAVDWPAEVTDSTLSALGQLLVRSVALNHSSDADSLLAAGIPSLMLSDSSLLAFDPAYHSRDDRSERLAAERLQRWTTLLTASVRRLDALPGRPRNDDQYLALGQRVVHRRQLLWIGFLLWCAMVLRGVPGAWRRASGEARRARGRSYLARLGFRMLYLGGLFLFPALAVLLFPAAAVVIVRSFCSRRWLNSAAATTTGLLIGWLPFLLWFGVIGFAWHRGFIRGWALGLTPWGVIGGSLLAFSLMLLAPLVPPRGTGSATG